MVKMILEYNHIEVSSRCTSASDVTLSFSCPASVSEVVLEQLENIGMDSWYGRIYVTACDLYRSSEEAEASLLKETMTSRLILVQEMINLIHDGAACTFDYVLLLISAGLMAALGLAGNSSVIVVASMLVSPLMGPILGIAFGAASFSSSPLASVIHDRALMRMSLRSEVIGILLCVRLLRSLHASSSPAFSSALSARRSRSPPAARSGPAGPPSRC